MSFTKLTKKQVDLHTLLVERLTKAKGDLEAAGNAYNEVVEEANEFMAEVISEQETHFDEKDEKWQDGEKGELYSLWLSAWQEAEIETVDLPCETEAFENLTPDPESI